MKVIWYVNIVMPKASVIFGLPCTMGGGWLEGQAEALPAFVDLHICTVTPLVKSNTTVQKAGITYTLVPSKDADKQLAAIVIEEKPDIVHVFGTEYRFNTGLIQFCAAQKIKFVVSLQGIMEQCARHYDDGLPKRFQKVNPARKIMRKLYYADSIALEKQRFERQAVEERHALQVTENVIGRTEWDYRVVMAINPRLRYFCVRENLREEFYEKEQWKYNSCQKSTLFLSQAFYPIKGFHSFLEALPGLIARYPDLQVYVAGQKAYSLGNPLLDFAVDYFFEYQAYIKKRLRELKIGERVHFLGALNAGEMKEQILRCNAFVSASTIENSPNSVGEAMILGAPVIASNVGGVGSMLINGKEGILYPFGDTMALQDAVIKVFDNPVEADKMGRAAQKHAKQTHDRRSNTQALLDCYKTIIEEQE